MKNLFAALIAALALVASLSLPAEARPVRLFYNIFGASPSIIRPVGPARPVTGPISDGQVFFRQDFAYLRVGVLTQALMKSPGVPIWEGYEAPAGTLVYALGGGEDAAWCTIPETTRKTSCFARGSLGYYWSPLNPPRLDPFRYLDLKYDGVAVPLGAGFTIDETTSPPAPLETLEISLNRIPPNLRRPNVEPRFTLKMVSGRTGLTGKWEDEPGLYHRLLGKAGINLWHESLELYTPEGPGVRLSRSDDSGGSEATALPARGQVKPGT